MIASVSHLHLPQPVVASVTFCTSSKFLAPSFKALNISVSETMAQRQINFDFLTVIQVYFQASVNTIR